MPENNQDSADNRTLTMRVIDALGTRAEVAKLIETRLGWQFTRQAIYKWYENGHVPLQGADQYARILAHEARKISFDVTKEELLADVQVPQRRMPKELR